MSWKSGRESADVVRRLKLLFLISQLYIKIQFYLLNLIYITIITIDSLRAYLRVNCRANHQRLTLFSQTTRNGNCACADCGELITILSLYYIKSASNHSSNDGDDFGVIG